MFAHAEKHTAATTSHSSCIFKKPRAQDGHCQESLVAAKKRPDISIWVKVRQITSNFGRHPANVAEKQSNEQAAI